ncbi:MAG: hypothetical protein Q4D26_09090 [Clostridia bacterium]|nr:hypothetical protein [Clostridia bacterium]
MIVLTFNVTGTDLRRTDVNRIVAVSRNNVSAKFNFNSDWDDIYPKVVQFYKDEEYYNVSLKNDECSVPWEVLTEKGTLSVTVTGGDLITTTTVDINVYGTSLSDSGLVPTKASPGVYSEIVKMADEISIGYNSIKSVMDTYEENIADSENRINNVINEAKTDLAESEAHTRENAVNAEAWAEEARETAEDIKERLGNISFSISSDDMGLDIIINEGEE